MLNPTTRVVGFFHPHQTMLAVLSFRALALRAKERSAGALRPVARSAKCVVQSSRVVHGVTVAGVIVMEDGILYLAARYYAAKSNAIRAEIDAMMADAVKYPDCWEDEAVVFSDEEIALDDLRHRFPQIVVDVTEGVDYDFRNDVDCLTEALDKVLSELMF